MESARFIGHDIDDVMLEELVARAKKGTLPFAIEYVVLLNGALFAADAQIAAAAG